MNQEVIDVHVHFGSPNDDQSGCYWSDEFTKTAAYYAMLLLTKSLFKKVNIQRVKDHIYKTINGSQYVNKSVLLAMDEVYDENGNIHKEWTHLFVPNNYIASLTKENNRILLGASVHPHRPDWSEELDRCLESKAVLCKWIPSSQMINPADNQCVAFYKKLAKHNLPLLIHAGPEYAIPTSNDQYNELNNPKNMRNALDEGVTVIIAHCAMPYFGEFDFNYLDDFEEFLKLYDEAEKKNWKLFADLSAICSPLRIKYVKQVKENADKIPHKSLLFGSDYPIPLSELSFNKSTNFFNWIRFIIKVAFMKNPLDKNFMLIKEMGFNDVIFTNASRLINSIKYS